MSEDYAARRQLPARMEGGEEKTAERGDDQDQERNRDDARYGLRFAEHHDRRQDQSGRAKRRMEQRERPRRKLIAQDPGRHDQAADSTDREDENRKLQHGFPPLLFARIGTGDATLSTLTITMLLKI